MELSDILKHWPSWAGSVPGWLMALSFLGILWKGLPAVLDSWSNSVEKERAAREEQVKNEREHREREVERLEGQIKAADDRHSECMDGQRKLRDEMAEMQRRHAEEIRRLQGLVSGMLAQIRQMQLSAAEGLPMSSRGLPPELVAMVSALDELPRSTGGKAKGKD